MMTSLRNKLWLAFGSLLSIVLVVSVLSIAVLTHHTHALEQVFRENYDSAVYIDGMTEAIDQLNIRAQQLIWEESTARTTDFTALESKFETNLHAQLGNAFLPGELDASKHLAGLWNDYKLHYQQFDSNGVDRPGEYRRDLLPRYGVLKQVAQKIADMNMSNMVSVDGQGKQSLLSVRRALLALVIGGTLLAGMVVWAVGVKLLRPLKELTHSAHEIEIGNLDLNLPEGSRDEIGQLASAFKSMASHLREFKRIDHDRLIRTQQTTQLAIDSLPDPVFIIGPDNHIEISNDAARRFFGIEPGRLMSDLGLNWLPPLIDEVKNNSRPVNLHGYKSAVQIFIDGEERFLLPRVVPMFSTEDQRQLGIAAILVDVTQLRHVDEAKSGLLSTVSHELRTPLTSQRLLLGLLMTSAGPNLSASQRRMLEVVKADSDRLNRTIDHLLGIGRIESGRAQFQLRPLRPHEIVLSSIEPLHQLFIDQKIQLIVNVPECLPVVQADASALNSALTNLLSNALKFTPADGRVTVACENGNNQVMFSVADTGMGIPVEFQSRIFEKFFRVPLSAGPSGAGLGLSITKNIIEAHGGQISFVCPPAGGTTFRFSLPVAPPS